VQHWRPPITGWNFPSKGIIVDVDDPDGAHPILKTKSSQGTRRRLVGQRDAVIEKGLNK
jgi:hypothetical protein